MSQASVSGSGIPKVESLAQDNEVLVEAGGQVRRASLSSVVEALAPEIQLNQQTITAARDEVQEAEVRVRDYADRSEIAMARAEAAAASVSLEVADYAALDALTGGVDVGENVRRTDIDQLYTRGNSGGHITNSQGVSFDVVAKNGVFDARAWGVSSTTDDSVYFAAIASALPNGATLRITTDVVLSSGVVFAQDNITFDFVGDVSIIRADGSEAIDTFLECTGDGVVFRNVGVDGNLAGNAGTVTGRSEMLKLSGADAVVYGARIKDIPDADHACGIYFRGYRPTIFNALCNNTGRHAIRDGADYTLIDGVVGTNIFNTSGVGSKLIVKDQTPDGVTPFSVVTYRNIIARSDDTGLMSAITIDHDGVKGKLAILESVDIDFPNSTGANCAKAAYCETVILRDWRTSMAGNATGADFRVQGGVDALRLENCNMGGGINFDDYGAEDECDIYLDGDTVLGRDRDDMPSCIGDLPAGSLTIEDGATLKGFTNQAIAVNPAATLPRMSIGRINIEASASAVDPELLLINNTGAKAGERPVAGNIVIDEPRSIANMDSYGDNSWITDSNAKDAAALQGGQRMHYLPTYWMTDNKGPNEVNGWKRGMVIHDRTGTVAPRRCTTAGASCRNDYANSTAYAVGAWIVANGNVYACTTAGTSASSGTGPSGTGAAITDGTAVFDYVAARAVFSA